MEDNVKEHLRLNQLQQNEKGELVIVHRKDDAVKVHYETAVALSGTISAPRKFLEERGVEDKKRNTEGMGPDKEAQQEVKRSHVLYNYRDLYIHFKGIENHPLSYGINGKLVINPDLTGLLINQKKYFSSKELSQHIRFNRLHFLSKEENLALVNNLASYKAKLSTEIEKEFNNTTGSKRDLYDVKVLNDGKPLGFTLNLPLYIGQTPIKFAVEILVDIQGRDINFWLESVDLVEALKTTAKDIIDGELAFFEAKGYVLIEQ